jgi:hypothetical protein
LDTPAQLAKHERRRRVLRRVEEAGCISSPSGSESQADPPSSESTSFEKHHLIATTKNSPIKLFTFLREHDGDPAVKVDVALHICAPYVAHGDCQNFFPKLKDHILYRLSELDVSCCDHTFTEEERNSVIIPNNTIYSVQTMQVHFTTYDMRREYDTINSRTHGDVMVLSGETAPSHPYWYARVLGIYHLEVWLNNRDKPVKRHLDVLWVRWLAALRNHKSGVKHARLPKVAFVDESDVDAFGFLDPGQVIRGAHLIPAFASKRGTSSLRHGTSLARPNGELDDWEEYYVGM